MIIRTLSRRPNVLQSLVSAPARCLAPPVARCIHTVPSLSNHEQLKRDGIPGLLSAKGFQTAYTDYMQLMVDELNTITAGTPHENKPTKDLITEFARDPMNAPLFNAASMAFNNHFFFNGIATNSNIQSVPSQDLNGLIREHFSSLETLRVEFIATAEAMFGPGFVWLVQDNSDSKASLAVLATYLAGSPLSGAHERRQSNDLNTHNTDSYQALNGVGAFGNNAKVPRRPKKPLGGVDVTPLLCVNTWEHVWLRDYGIRGKGEGTSGKREYLEKWWTKIDWNKVLQHATIPKSTSQQGRNTFVNM